MLTAKNGKDAFVVLARNPAPRLILLDLMMPVMDGWQFSDAIQSDPVLAKVPVVVITAFAEQADGVRATGLVKKPVNLDELLEVIGKSLLKEAG